MLADAASVSEGKLYINGGGWNTLFAQQIPVVHPALALVLGFRFSWNDANEDIPFEISLLDDDDKPMSIQGKGRIRSAPAPYVLKGSDFFESFAQMFFGLKFEHSGNYRFKVTSNDRELASIPLAVTLHPAAPRS